MSRATHTAMSLILGAAAAAADAPTPATEPNLVVTVGLMEANWYLASTVESSENPSGDQSSRVHYDISPSVVRSAEVGAAWGRVRLGLSMAEDLQLSPDPTYHDLAGVLDVLVSGDGWMRLRYEEGRLRGHATWEQAGGATDRAAVDTTWQRSSVLYAHGAVAMGLSYEALTVPVAMGYVGPDKQIVYSTFVPDSRWRVVEAVIGYDHRRTLDMERKTYVGLTGSFEAGLGYGWFTVPGRVQHDAQAATGLSGDSDASGVVISLDASLGMAAQGRIPHVGAARAFLGARARWIYTDTSPTLSDTKAPDPGTMWLKVDFQELMWGPTLEGTLIF